MAILYDIINPSYQILQPQFLSDPYRSAACFTSSANTTLPLQGCAGSGPTHPLRIGVQDSWQVNPPSLNASNAAPQTFVPLAGGCRMRDVRRA